MSKRDVDTKRRGGGRGGGGGGTQKRRRRRRRKGKKKKKKIKNKTKKKREGDIEKGEERSNILNLINVLYKLFILHSVSKLTCNIQWLLFRPTIYVQSWLMHLNTTLPQWADKKWYSAEINLFWFPSWCRDRRQVCLQVKHKTKKQWINRHNSVLSIIFCDFFFLQGSIEFAFPWPSYLRFWLHSQVTTRRIVAMLILKTGEKKNNNVL